MLKLKTLKKELAEETLKAKVAKNLLDKSVQDTKSHTHSLLTSPKALAISLASGALTGWMITRKPKRNTNEDQNDNNAQHQKVSKQPSFLSDIGQQVLKNSAGIIATLVTAQVAKSMEATASAEDTEAKEAMQRSIDEADTL